MSIICNQFENYYGVHDKENFDDWYDKFITPYREITFERLNNIVRLYYALKKHVEIVNKHIHKARTLELQKKESKKEWAKAKEAFSQIARYYILSQNRAWIDDDDTEFELNPQVVDGFQQLNLPISDIQFILFNSDHYYFDQY